MIKVKVEVKGAPYKIYLGKDILGRITKELEKLNPSSIMVVSNTTVWELYGQQALDAASKVCKTEKTVLPDGEEFKRWPAVSLILENLAQTRADRKSVIVALGGGVVGDMAGFAASIYMRGIRFIQVPTTLLAQVDASVGGKTGINMDAGKNLIGSFHQPSAVIADTKVLRTLPHREVVSGIAEIIKHGLLADKKYFEQVEKHIESLVALDPEVTAYVVARSCEIKAGVVAKDTKEHGERAKLNLGHTFGHAIEKLTGFGFWHHGEAVACGCVLAAKLSHELGTLHKEEVERIVKLFEKVNLPTKAEGLKVDDAIAAMKGDKKTTAGVLRFILLNGIGTSYIKEVDENTLRKVLKSEGFV